MNGRLHDGWVEVTVNDTGPGIHPDLHERIFDFNFSGSSRVSGKLGFGLWWVRTIIARFGGAIELVQHDEPGATFLLRLPIEREK